MASLYIYNMFTDFMRGDRRPNITMPQKLLYLQMSGALLPAYLAKKGDIIVVLNDDRNAAFQYADKELIEVVRAKELKVITLKELPQFLKEFSIQITEIKPWGWDKHLRDNLLNSGIEENLLPSLNNIEWINKLSHRNTALKFNSLISELDPNIVINISREMKTQRDIILYCRANPKVWLKAPWSSSGRGILRSEDSSEEKIIQWSKSIIQRQGSVMVECEEDKKLDCASEWIVKHDRDVEYCGMSLFKVSGRGVYKGNEDLSREDAEQFISANTSDDLFHILDLQRDVIKSIIAPHYIGPLGIDMMVRNDYTINPCVEINLRYTMGHISLKKNFK